jgi:hypothetical protein
VVWVKLAPGTSHPWSSRVVGSSCEGKDPAVSWEIDPFQERVETPGNDYLDAWARGVRSAQLLTGSAVKEGSMTTLVLIALMAASASPTGKPAGNTFDEMLSIITPALYSTPRSPARQAQIQAITKRAFVRFSPEQIRELMLLESNR